MEWQITSTVIWACQHSQATDPGKAGEQICLDSDSLPIVPRLHASAQQETLICRRASEDTVKTARQAITIITAFQPSASRELCSFRESIWFQTVSTTGWRVLNNVCSSMKKQGLSADEVKYNSILLQKLLTAIISCMWTDACDTDLTAKWRGSSCFHTSECLILLACLLHISRNTSELLRDYADHTVTRSNSTIQALYDLTHSFLLTMISIPHIFIYIIIKQSH